MFVVDGMNNVRRYCSVVGVEGHRVWRVMNAVSGSRYMLRHVDTEEFVTVSRDELRHLY